MESNRLDTGMYIIDKEYRIVNFNRTMGEMYPDVKLGDICYQALALQDAPCESCPLVHNDILFYNPFRKEWISANAAEITYPGHGECHNIQFKTQKDVGESSEVKKNDRFGFEKVGEHVADLQEQNRELLKKESQTQSILYKIPGAYHRCAPQEGYPFLHISESFEEIAGWTKEEIETNFDNKFLNLVLPEDQHLFDNLVEQIEDKGEGNSIYRLKRKNGGYRWVQDSTMYVDLGDDSFYQCTLADITEFVEKQEKLAIQNVELQQRESLFNAIAQKMPGGYHRVGASDGFPLLFCSDSFLEIVGWTREELQNELDNRFIYVVAPEDRALFMSMEPELVRDGRVKAVYRIHRKDGSRRWVQDTTMRVEQDGEVFYQCTLADITEYVEKLNEEKERAEASNRAKSVFLFNASHDIRTPMNAIQGFTKILKQNPDDGEQVREIIAKIEKSSETLMKLLSDVLELSRIENGKESVDLVVTDLNELSDKLHTMLAEEIETLGITFKLENRIQNSFVWCDELKLTQIGMNMLSNAKKFTPAGGTITFGIEQQPADKPEYANYRFYVRDTGIGMSEEFLNRAFGQFERERTATESGVMGSGLGLSIIKKLTELMGGTCTLKSQLGKGTEISSIVKLRTATGKEEETEYIECVDVDFAGKRVLLVEDNDFNREIARFILEDLGFFVEEAENGSDAVNTLLHTEAGWYDVVLMDIQMPVMDGYTAAQEIRRIADPQISSVPIIAMTANAFLEDKEKCISVGMNGHISKPIDVNILITELVKHCY